MKENVKKKLQLIWRQEKFFCHAAPVQVWRNNQPSAKAVSKESSLKQQDWEKIKNIKWHKRVNKHLRYKSKQRFGDEKANQGSIRDSMAYSFIWLCEGAYSKARAYYDQHFADTPLNLVITGTHRQCQLCNSILAKDDQSSSS